MAARGSAIYAVVRGLWYLVLLVVVVPFLLFGAAQSRIAKDWLAQQISAAASDETTTLSISRIDGLLPVELTIDAVSVADAEGTWLTAEAIELRWSPAQLLGGTLHVDFIGAKKVAVARAPAGADGDDGTAEPAALESPVAVVIDRMDFPHIALAEPVAGVAAIFGAGGALGLDIDRGVVTAALAAERKDGVAGSLTLNADYVLDDQSVTLDLKAEEPAGGIVAGLIGLPRPADVSVEAQGAGTLDAWAGTAAARIAGYVDLDADVSLRAEQGGHAFALAVEGDAAELVGVFAPDAAPLLEPGIALSVAGTRAAAGRLTFDQVTAASGPTRLDANGWFDPAAGTTEITFDAQIAAVTDVFAPDLTLLVADGVAGQFAGTVAGGGLILIDKARIATTPVGASVSGQVDLAAATLGLDFDLAVTELGRLADLAGLPLAGGAAAVGRLDGPFEAAALSQTRITVTDFATDGAAFARFEGTFSAAPDTTWTDAAPRIAFDGDGFVSGLTVAGQEQVIAALVDERVDWRVAGTASPAETTVDLSEFSLASETALAGGTAAVQRGRDVDASVVVQLDALDRFAELAGSPLAGSLQSSVDLSGDLTTQSFTVSLDTGFDGLSTGVPAADIALGPRPALAALVEAAETGAITVSELSLRGRALSISGSAGLSADQAVSGALSVTVPDLSSFDALAGAPLAGGVVVDMTPSGTIAAPAVDIAFVGSALAYADMPALALTGTASARDLLTAPQGAVALRGAADEVEARVATAYALDGAQLRLAGLEAEAAGLSATGDVALDLDTTLVTGRLSGRSDDLGPVASLAGLNLGGALTFDATLGTRDGGQAVSVDAETRSFSFPDADVSVGRAAVQAAGSLEALDFELAVADAEVSGRAIALDGNGTVALADGVTQATIASLRAVVDALPIELTQPARIVQAPNRISVSDLSVLVADGTIAGDAELRPDRVQATVTAEGITLATFRPGTEGTVDASLAVTGTAPFPDATLSVAVNGFRDADLTGEDVPQLDATAEARWSQGQLDATAELTGPKDAWVRGTVGMPLALSADTLAPVIDEGAALVGQIDGQAELAEFAPLFLSDLDRLAGQLSLEVQIAGTLAAPIASGALTVADGVYENGLAGTVLTDLNLDLAGDGRELVLRRLSARDGGSGTIDGSGRVGLDAAEGFPADVEVNFANFLAVRRPDAEVPLDGTVTAAGTMADYAVVGRLTVPQAEIRIPEQLPANVVELDVIEVGGDFGAISPEAGQSPAEETPAPTVTLDVTVDMPGRVFVRGRGLTSEWRGGVQVSGTAEAPVVEGGLTLVQGNFDLVGKLLTLERGAVTLAKEDPGNPEIDALATTDLDDGTARIEITGTASAPDIALSSEPPLPEDEVLARLLFGSSVGDLSPVQAVQLANGVATLTGQGSGLGMLDKVREATGVDVLDVRSDGEAADGTSVRAGKYLADDVLLYIEQGARPGSSKATLEVELNDYLSVETDVGADSQSAIGVNIKTDY